MAKKIRVLHTEWSDGWGGQEIRIINEMVAMRELGVKVFLACRENSKIRQKALDRNVKVFTLPFRGNADLITIFRLRRIIKENQIDIVNTHSGKDSWTGGFAAKLAKVKFIRTRHLSNPINLSRLNFINEIADYIFTTGESVRVNMISRNRILPTRIKSVPTGIDHRVFNPMNFKQSDCKKLFGFETDEIILGTLAVLRRFKRHDRFLNMARFVIDSNPDKKIRFVIAGEGPQRDKLKDLITKLRLEENVILLGHVTNVPELLTALDIFVLTSDSGEGVPQSVMQALLMRKPTVSTDAGSTRDLYSKNNFMLVNKDSQDEINNKCNKFVASENLRKIYASVSREFVVENFSQAKMATNIMKIYKNLLSNECSLY